MKPYFVGGIVGALVVLALLLDYLFGRGQLVLPGSANAAPAQVTVGLPRSIQQQLDAKQQCISMGGEWQYTNVCVLPTEAPLWRGTMPTPGPIWHP